VKIRNKGKGRGISINELSGYEKKRKKMSVAEPD